MEHQEHFGRKFYQDKKTGYWISSDYPRIRAHRWVWNNLHGTIPKGYHIHHRDENKSNNNISNLEIIEASRHLSHHMKDPLKKSAYKEWIDIIRPLAREWHGSPEGKAWHKLHAIKCKFGTWDPIDYKCEQCGKEFQSSKRSNTRFCSNNCKSAWRRCAGFDNEERICKNCGSKFEINKYSKTLNCSKKCAQAFRKLQNIST